MAPDLALMLVTGLAAGVVSGLLGVGGGIVMTPVLHYVRGLEWADAVALSLFAIAVQSPIGAARHRARGAVDGRVGMAMVVGALAGVAIGEWLFRRIEVPWLKLGFALVMALAAWRLVARMHPGAARPPAVPFLVVLGVAAGLAGRLFGIGGGLVTVPVLMRLGVPGHTAVGSSLLPVFATAAAATLVRLHDGLDPLAGMGLAAGALAGAPVGVRAAHALSGPVLQRVFAVAMGVVAVYVGATSGAL